VEVQGHQVKDLRVVPYQSLLQEVVAAAVALRRPERILQETLAATVETDLHPRLQPLQLLELVVEAVEQDSRKAEQPV
jgi:hypothetical protein